MPAATMVGEGEGERGRGDISRENYLGVGNPHENMISISNTTLINSLYYLEEQDGDDVPHGHP